MLDELKADSQADYIGGFPPHPHRGIETLTYMLQGHFQHRDQMEMWANYDRRRAMDGSRTWRDPQ